ncbi:MAG: GTPase domain-containing protein [Polyangiaceae bacterium]|nr:GTPase domain-containing protein [Polyangiaceae bacterium]
MVVTLFGPYDSGRSSLLKRLFVDDGKPVPDWLTVSGRRETLEPQEVSVASVAGLVVRDVRDTPGIAGGNELHEAIAKEALLLTDAIALVLPPQLVTSVTSDRESLVGAFNGRRFGCAARSAFAERGLPIVLSRMDEAGAMPRDDSRGYRELVERKQRELSDLLRSEGEPRRSSSCPRAYLLLRHGHRRARRRPSLPRVVLHGVRSRGSRRVPR